MKRTKTTLVLLALLLALGGGVVGCVNAEVHDKVVRLRRLHADYRSATTPRSDLDPTKVEALAGKIDETLANLEEVTK